MDRKQIIPNPALPASKNGEVHELIQGLLEAAGGSPHAEFLEEMIQTVLRLVENQAERGEIKILNAALRELVYAFRVFAPYRGTRKVTMFGSARTTEDQPEYRQALNFAHEISRQGWMVITGAGDGIMKAAQGGAGRERGVAGERELRGEEQFPAGFPGIRAGSVGEVERAGDEGAEV